jgi:hypothetical protein
MKLSTSKSSPDKISRRWIKRCTKLLKVEIQRVERGGCFEKKLQSFAE